MNVFYSPQFDNLNAIRTIDLGHPEGCPPGLLRTIISDSDNHLYLSDELNHRIISFDQDGNLRWLRGKRGNGRGDFFYPRGMAVGQIKMRGRVIPCLAVADAWNRRVHFLDLDGNPLHIWTAADSIPFGEITDVRFIEANLTEIVGTSGTGFWLVLDKSGHRLFGISQEGSLIFQTGQCFPYGLENHWAAPELFFSSRVSLADLLKSVSSFDFLYYPDRILGSSMKALFISEPYRRRIKQLIHPHLFPIALHCESEIEYIAADEMGLIGWHRPTCTLMQINSECRPSLSSEIQGIPIAGSSREVWIQNEEHLELLQWQASDSEASAGTGSKVFAPLLETAERERAQSESSTIRIAIEACFEAAENEADLADLIVSIVCKGMDPDQLNKEEGLYVYRQRDRGDARLGLRKALHHWCLGTLEKALLGADCSITVVQSCALHLQLQRLAQLQVKISGILGRIEDGLTQLQSAAETHNGSSISPEKRIQSLCAARNDLWDIQLWMGLCLGIPTH
ncbi:MAG: hypothetical protein JXA73_15905 [Acidobacteria bacterium]|nr:hypothetical protein [Acidobacteriota bacterium]